MQETSSGEHKVKIAGVMISEESGETEGIRNHQAVEYVHDISARAKDNQFEVSACMLHGLFFNAAPPIPYVWGLLCVPHP